MSEWIIPMREGTVVSVEQDNSIRIQQLSNDDNLDAFVLIAPDDIPKVISFLQAAYEQSISNRGGSAEETYRPGDEEEDEDDPMMAKALKIVEEHGTISTSMLQRKLRIGYNKAARLVEQMEKV